MKIAFTKMQALGNDFVVIDRLRQEAPLDEGTVVRLCDRRFGIGADQLLTVEPSSCADYRMRVYNADGGEVEMCGNGIRCVARYLVSRALAREGELRIETRAGIIKPRAEGESVRVDMGEPELEGERIPVTLKGRVIDGEVQVGGAARRITCVSMGNPHCILFVDDLAGYPVAKTGPAIERDPLFPRRTNVEFIRVESPERVSMRVWERGAGETLACGTGACAATVACCLNGKTGRIVTVALPGGELFIEWAEDNHVFMTGPAEEVFVGEALLSV